MADSFKIVASLDINKSAKLIKDDIPKLQEYIKNEKIEITAGLNLSKSQSLIQAQLNTIANQAKAPTIHVGVDLGNSQSAVQGATNGLKTVQEQAKQTASAVNNVKSELIKLDTTAVKSTSFEMGVDQDKIFNLEKTLENARNALSKFGKVDLSWLKDSAGEVTTITAKITDATGAVERFHYALNEDTQKFDWAGSTGTDSGVEKLITSMQKAQDKVKALRTNLTADLKSIRSAWQDVNGGKSVKSDENIERLKQQYIKVTQAIRELRKADDTTLASMKANADTQIDKLNQMVAQYHNAEKVATQLRAKGFETVKIDTGNNIDKFINSINNSKVPIQAIQTEINKLTSDFAQLDTIQDQVGKSAALTNILNTLDNAKTKFQSLKELFKGFGNADWISVNSEQINKINDMATKIAIYKSNLTATRDEWKSQGIYVGEIQAKVTSLARSLPNIKKPEKFNEWVQEWNDINQKANQLKTNLDSQVATHNKIYEIQSQIAKLNPTKDSAEIARLNEKLSAEQKTLSNLQMQSNVFSNLVSLEQQEQYITEQTVKTREKLLSATNTGVKQYQSSITSAISDLQGILNKSTFTKNASNPQVTQTKQEITQLLAEYQNLKTQMQGNVTPEGLKSIGNQLTKLNARFNTTTATAQRFEQSLKDDNGAEKFKQKVSILIAQIKEFQKVNSRSLKKYGTDFNRMLDGLTNPNLDTQGLERIRVEFQNIKREINTAGLAGKDFFGRIKEQAAKFASWMSLTGVITGAWHEVKKMVTNVIELDNCLLELSKVSDLSATGLKSITKEAYEMGKQVGKTGTDVINAVTNFKRAGFDLKESMSFAKDALVLTNVAEGITDTGEAATALISIMKGYGDTSLEFSQKILDATNEVSNTQAINFDDLIDGSQRLSAVAKQAGVSYEQMLGILTGTNEVLQNIEKTASGQITIFTRLQGIQLPDEEDVMPIAKLQETINKATKGAVNIVDQTSGELRNVYDILNDINKVWDTLDKNTQEGIAFAAAGTRQKNVFLSMMENWKNVESATKSAQNSLGSAAIENQKHLDSISGKLANLESSFQSLSQTVINSDLIKFVVDSGTNILNILDGIIGTLGAFPTLLGGIAAYGAFKNVGSPKMFGLVLICQQ